MRERILLWPLVSLILRTPMPSKTSTRGFTLIELLLVVAIIAIVAGLAIPGLLRSRMAANEASAIGSLRAILSAEQDFASMHRGFADNLATLAGTCPGMSTPFVPADLSANGVVKSGYAFRVLPGLGGGERPADCFGNPTRSAYYASAAPQMISISGARAFAANASATIWQDTTGTPPTEPFTPTATVQPLASR